MNNIENIIDQVDLEEWIEKNTSKQDRIDDKEQESDEGKSLNLPQTTRK